MKAILFFADTIRIRPHSASHPAHLGRSVTLREFAGERPIRLAETDDGELLASYGVPGGDTYRFIQGPEATE